jgi:type IV secretion system protein VirB8
MDDLNRSISQYVKSGQYYVDARTWYANRFVFLLSERTYVLIFLSFFAAGLLILGYFYQATNPAPRHISYISPTEDIAKTYSVIVDAGHLPDTPQMQVTKYMLHTYVTRREQYRFGHVKEQLSFVRNTTVADEYLKYEHSISINNPSSPLMIYQDNNEKIIKITQVKMLKSPDTYLRAVVYFDSTIRNLATNRSITEELVATLAFRIDDIKTLLDDKAKKLGFLVVRYDVLKP